MEPTTVQLNMDPKCNKNNINKTTSSVSLPSNGITAKAPVQPMNKSWKCDKNFFTKQIEKLFYKQGLLVSKYPYAFLIIPFILMVALSCGLLKIKLSYESYRIFAPTNAPSNNEYKIFLDYFNDVGGVFTLALAVVATDGGSVLREGYRSEILNLFNYFESNYTVLIDGHNYTFKQLQINHQDDNKIGKLALEYYNSSKIPIDLNYPIVTLNNDQYYLGTYWRNVTVNPDTNVTEMRTIFYGFTSARGDDNHAVLLREWARSFLSLNSTLDAFPNLKINFWCDDVYNIEIFRNAVVFIPYVVLGFGALMIFACLVSWSKNPVKAKPWECLISIFCVILSAGASFGTLCLADFEFGGTIVTSPVLILALGMDVTYITLRTWQTTDRNLQPDIRLAKTLSEAGPSIVITSMTNLVSAALGCITNIPVTYTFCLSIVIAVAFLFLLQITIFPAAIILGARREARNMHGFLCCLRVSPKETPKLTQKTGVSLPDIALVTMASPAPSTTKTKDWWNSVSAILSKILCTNYCRFAVTIALSLYLATSIYCCTRSKVGLTPERLLLPDSKLLSIIKLDRETMQPANGEPLFVIVQNPPDLNIKTERLNMENIVKEFESLPRCLGPSATSFWLRQFLNWLEFLDDDNGNKSLSLPFNSYLIDFLNTAEGSRWKNYIVFDRNNNFTINKFMFSVVYQRTKDFQVRIRYTNDWRSLAARYPKYNIITWFFDNYNFITDQLESIPGSMIQDLVIMGICMTFICILFIPNVFSTICSVLTIFSISIGVYGYLTNWDAALDPVTMTAFLIAVGYSVDFTSHITFHYYVSDGVTPQLKLHSALSSIGLPMLETGISTMLCVGCTALAGGYMITVFVKSIFLVVLSGLIHGLIILPTFLAWIPIDVLDKLFALNKKHRIHKEPNAGFNFKAETNT